MWLLATHGALPLVCAGAQENTRGMLCAVQGQVERPELKLANLCLSYNYSLVCAVANYPCHVHVHVYMCVSHRSAPCIDHTTLKGSSAAAMFKKPGLLVKQMHYV